MTKVQESRMLVWRELSFPLWRTPRPQFEEFAFVDTVLKKQLKDRTDFSRIDPQDHAGWLRWEFMIPIADDVRHSIQAALTEHFGEEAHFRWGGYMVLTYLYDTHAFNGWSPQ